MISLIFFALAAICSAVMDIIENENFFTSIFINLQSKFWYKRESWKESEKVINWKFDGWHLFKSTMIIFILGAILFYKPIESINWLIDLVIKESMWRVICQYSVHLLIFSAVWDMTFNLFYNKILRYNTWNGKKE